MSLYFGILISLLETMFIINQTSTETTKRRQQWYLLYITNLKIYSSKQYHLRIQSNTKRYKKRLTLIKRKSVIYQVLSDTRTQYWATRWNHYTNDWFARVTSNQYITDIWRIYLWQIWQRERKSLIIVEDH